MADINTREVMNKQLTLMDSCITLMEQGNRRSQHEPPRIDPSDDGSMRYDTRGTGPILFGSFGEQLNSVMRASQPGERADPRLYELAEARATGMSEGVASEGGFVLQDNFSNQILANAWDMPGVLDKVNKYPITKGNNIKIPAVNETSRADGSRGGGVQAFWIPESGAKTPSQADFRRIELTLKKLVALIYTTDELLDDAPALEKFVRQAVEQEFQFKLIDALINGTGAGMPLGILLSPCLVTQAAEVGQTGATVVYENIVKMYSRMPASSWKNAVWHVNQDVVPQLFDMGITVGFGGSPVFMPAGGISGLPYNTLMGRPIIPLEQCQSIGAKGDIFFCDWSKYVGIDKGGLQSAVSIHLKFQYDESVFRSRQASHEGDFMVKSSLIRGNLSHLIRQSRASKDLKSWASVETLQEPSLN